jgi:hypothetical protein
MKGLGFKGSPAEQAIYSSEKERTTVGSSIRSNGRLRVAGT